MDIAVCQEYLVGGYPSRDALIDHWEKALLALDGVESVRFHDVFHRDRAEAICSDVDAVLGMNIESGFFDQSFFETYPRIQYVSTHAHGYGTIDLEAARAAGVTFTNTVYGAATVAQYTMALLLELCHGVGRQDQLYKAHVSHIEQGKPSELQIARRQMELSGKTIGIIGLGHIGFQMAKMADAFGMEVIAYNRSQKVGSAYDFIEQVSLDQVYRRSDVISLHCALTEETHHMIHEDAFKQMKDQVVLLNTARGGLIHEPSLIHALESGKVALAGLDVVQGEPLNQPHPLMAYDQVILTPHIAWLSESSRFRTIDMGVANFNHWLQGKPTSVIS